MRHEEQECFAVDAHLCIKATARLQIMHRGGQESSLHHLSMLSEQLDLCAGLCGAACHELGGDPEHPGAQWRCTGVHCHRLGFVEAAEQHTRALPHHSLILLTSRLVLDATVLPA